MSHGRKFASSDPDPTLPIKDKKPSGIERPFDRQSFSADLAF